MRLAYRSVLFIPLLTGHSSPGRQPTGLHRQEQLERDCPWKEMAGFLVCLLW